MATKKLQRLFIMVIGLLLCNTAYYLFYEFVVTRAVINFSVAVFLFSIYPKEYPDK
jgi:hypothetical protein